MLTMIIEPLLVGVMMRLAMIIMLPNSRVAFQHPGDFIGKHRQHIDEFAPGMGIT
jgi:hypothetical protein